MKVRLPSSSLWICIFGLFAFAGACSEPGSTSEPKREIGLPTANNFRQVPATDFFFVLDLEWKDGKSHLRHGGVPLSFGDVDKIAELYQARKDQEGGHADVVVAAKADVPSEDVLSLVADLRSLDVLQVNFQVAPPENGGKIPASALGLMVHQFPPLQDSTIAIRIPDSSRLVVTALPDAQVAVEADTFSTNALGGHLKRIFNNNEDPQLRISLNAAPKTNFEALIAAFDQIIISGFKQYDIFSKEEMADLPVSVTPLSE